jgi:hypothetical protein
MPLHVGSPKLHLAGAPYLVEGGVGVGRAVFSSQALRDSGDCRSVREPVFASLIALLAGTASAPTKRSVTVLAR